MKALVARELSGPAGLDYTEVDENVARSGLIALQIHGGQPAEASYKDIRLKPLPTSDK